MENPQTLGGTRQSSPLDDEMTYPLTNDEFLTLKENLISDKLTNWESFLLSTFIACFISGIIIWVNGSFQNITIKDGKRIVTENYRQIIIVIVYGAISIGTLLALIFSRINKPGSSSYITRLSKKIEKHLSK
ncbi:MAG: hypothetical protein JWN78_223 [Bacteroidota bacterium]|nr:hypothetical protein [Bacteroidota bacterium]